MHLSLLSLLLLLTGSQQVAPFPFNSIEPDLTLPAGQQSWVVEVVTRGGLDGRGTGDILVTSEGKLSRSFRDVSHKRNIKKDALSTFAEFIAPATSVEWGNSSLGTCMDCIATLIRVKVKGSGGAADRVFIGYWDVTTQRRVPEEVLRLYKAAVALGGQ